MGSARVFVCVCARVFGGVGDTATSAAAACCHKVAVCSRHRQLLLSAHVHTTPARAPTKCLPFHISNVQAINTAATKLYPAYPATHTLTQMTTSYTHLHLYHRLHISAESSRMTEVSALFIMHVVCV